MLVCGRNNVYLSLSLKLQVQRNILLLFIIHVVRNPCSMDVTIKIAQEDPDSLLEITETTFNIYA
jgi:hypothetical protein